MNYKSGGDHLEAKELKKNLNTYQRRKRNRRKQLESDL